MLAIILKLYKEIKKFNKNVFINFLLNILLMNGLVETVRNELELNLTSI